MSEAKFTGGPWDIEIGCSQAFVATENKFIHESNVDFATGNRDERVANAHLIAAAPEMYAEIERDIAHLRVRARSAKCEDIRLRLVAEMTRKINLLAKARGEQ